MNRRGRALAFAITAILAAVPGLAAQDPDSGLGDLGALFQALSSPAPTPAPSAARFNTARVPVPTPTMAEKRACPVCGTAVPAAKSQASAVWGSRLDLRLFGAGVVDPPDLPICPSCRCPLYADSIGALEADRLRAFVGTPEYKGIERAHFPYYFLARVQEAKAVPLRYGSYSIALSYLRAAWQAEDYRDEARTALYLEKALAWMDAYAREVKRGDYYYATSRLLPAEILRRLGRFAEAEARLKPLEREPDFSSAYLKKIVKAELALVAAGERSPQASP